ncbi:hypothetical protein [Zhihengliuella flava]|uniref:Uncharacterized protein n=1 Tax=Zhihengliuella flava TaxID=1285193 RepID=A0A931D9A6_9MICC|nr:hypothetical protein [Zhihengliuella flava]MBG6084729.1 hypothetical protein [Zhihengliuella flava]
MEALAIIGTGILILIVAKMLRKKPPPQVHDAGRSSQQRSGANPDPNWEDHVNHHHPGIGLELAVGIGAGALISRSRDAGEEAELGSLVEADEFEHERGYYEDADPGWEDYANHHH